MKLIPLPFHVPGLQVSTSPGDAVPVIVGGVVLPATATDPTVTGVDDTVLLLPVLSRRDGAGQRALPASAATTTYVVISRLAIVVGPAPLVGEADAGSLRPGPRPGQGLADGGVPVMVGSAVFVGPLPLPPPPPTATEAEVASAVPVEFVARTHTPGLVPSAATTV